MINKAPPISVRPIIVRAYGRFVFVFGRLAFIFVFGRLAFEFALVLVIGVLVGIGVDVGIVFVRLVLLAAVFVFAGAPQAMLKAPKANKLIVASVFFI